MEQGERHLADTAPLLGRKTLGRYSTTAKFTEESVPKTFIEILTTTFSINFAAMQDSLVLQEYINGETLKLACLHTRATEVITNQPKKRLTQ